MPIITRLVKKSTAEAEALGRSDAGIPANGASLRSCTWPLTRSDVKQAEALLGEDCPEAVIADRGYDADWFMGRIEALGVEAVISPKRNRREPHREYDRNLHADRNKVERFIGRIKQYRRVATRYEKTASSYLAMVQVASILTLLL